MYYIMDKQLNTDMCADNTMACFTGVVVMVVMYVGGGIGWTSRPIKASRFYGYWVIRRGVFDRTEMETIYLYIDIHISIQWQYELSQLSFEEVNFD